MEGKRKGPNGLLQARWYSGMTQSEVARGLLVTRPRVAVMEAYETSSMQVRTLASYARAVGGELHVEIVFKDGTAIPLEVDRED